MFGRQYAHYSLAFEDLLADPRQKLVELFRVAGIANYSPEKLLELIDKPALGKWKAYADDEWFARNEADCEAVLRDFFVLDQPRGVQRSERFTELPA